MDITLKTKDQMKEDLKKTAKELVLHCFRNSHLESIHAGEKNGGVGDGFGDEEMKKMMIEVVDNTYTFLCAIYDITPFDPKMKEWIRMNRSIDGWNEPKIRKDWVTE